MKNVLVTTSFSFSREVETTSYLASVIKEEDNYIHVFYKDEHEINHDLTLTFGVDEVMCKSINETSSSSIHLKIGEMTSGFFKESGLDTKLEFVAKAIYHKKEEIFIEFDIYSSLQLVASNSIRIEEVK